jgi:hypothetical protein
VAFVAAALAAKTHRIFHTEIERGAFFFTGVAEIYTDAMRALGNCEGNFKVGLVLRAGDITCENKIWSRSLLP